PLLGVGLDAGGAKPLLVVPGGPDLDRASPEAVPKRRPPNESFPVELDERPAHRPRETDAGVVPAHRLRERKAADDRVELLGQRLGQRPARALEAEETLASLERAHLDAMTFREPRRRLVGEV